MREEQEELAQIVGKPTAMISATQHVQNLDASSRNARQYRGNLSNYHTGVDKLQAMQFNQSLIQSSRAATDQVKVALPITRRLDFETSPVIISGTRKLLTKKYVAKLNSSDHFPSAEKRNYKSVMKKLQGRKKDDTLVGMIVDSKPKTVEEAASIALLCNEDKINN